MVGFSQRTKKYDDFQFHLKHLCNFQIPWWCQNHLHIYLACWTLKASLEVLYKQIPFVPEAWSGSCQPLVWRGKHLWKTVHRFCNSGCWSIEPLQSWMTLGYQSDQHEIVCSHLELWQVSLGSHMQSVWSINLKSRGEKHQFFFNLIKRR